MFFPLSDTNKLYLSKSLQNSTLCLIKPHAMIEGKCGDILSYITEHRFVIKAMKMFNLNRQMCEEFYEVYNGVSPDYLVCIAADFSITFINSCGNNAQLIV